MKEFDFTVERNGHCKVFRTSQRADTIALCKSVFDAMIVVNALEAARNVDPLRSVFDDADSRHREKIEREIEDTLFDPS